MITRPCVRPEPAFRTLDMILIDHGWCLWSALPRTSKPILMPKATLYLKGEREQAVSIPFVDILTRRSRITYSKCCQTAHKPICRGFGGLSGAYCGVQGTAFAIRLEHRKKARALVGAGRDCITKGSMAVKMPVFVISPRKLHRLDRAAFCVVKRNLHK